MIAIEKKPEISTGLWRGPKPPVSVIVAFLFVSLIFLIGLFGEPLARDAAGQDMTSISQPPSSEHWLGTDRFGRDVLARLVIGTSTALLGPFLIAGSGLLISALLGITAAYLGGWVDTAIMRWVDFMIALPGLLVSIVVVSVLGGGYGIAIVVLSIFNVQGDIRIIRGAALEQKPLPYVESLRSLGFSKSRIMFRHIVPNVSPLLVADFAIDYSLALVALAGLSFLGLGAEPGTPEWGAMLAENQSIIFSNAAAALGPGFAIVLLAVAVNLIGDWLYDRYSAPGRLV